MPIYMVKDGKKELVHGPQVKHMMKQGWKKEKPAPNKKPKAEPDEASGPQAEPDELDSGPAPVNVAPLPKATPAQPAAAADFLK